MQCWKCLIWPDNLRWKNCSSEGRLQDFSDGTMKKMSLFRQYHRVSQRWTLWPLQHMLRETMLVLVACAGSINKNFWFFWEPPDLSYFLFRQTLAEFNPGIKIYLVRLDGSVKITSLSYQLPDAFTPKKLALKFYNGDSNEESNGEPIGESNGKSNGEANGAINGTINGKV